MIWIFVVLLLIQYYADLYLRLLNLRYAFRKEHTIPVLLEDVITQEKFEKSKEYLKDNTHFQITRKAIDFAVLMMWLLFLIPVLEKIAMLYINHPIWQGLLFFGLIFLVSFLVDIPFSLYESFIIEKKYDFNKMTARTFWLDLFKNFLTTVLLGGLLLWPVLLVVQSPIWWWKFSLIMLGFFFISLWIGPVLLMPLFNRFTPLEEGELKEAIHQFSAKHLIPVNRIFVMDASKRSTHGNAFFTGIGPTQRLVLYDTLLSYPQEEILSIIGHEWGHWKHKDIWRQIGWLLVIETGLFLLANWLFNTGWIQSGFHVSTTHAVLFYTLSFLTPILFFIEPVISLLTRTQEFSADQFSAKLLGKTEPGIQGLKRIMRDNLANLHPHPLYKTWFYSHPAPEERIQALTPFPPSQKT